MNAARTLSLKTGHKPWKLPICETFLPTVNCWDMYLELIRSEFLLAPEVMVAAGKKGWKFLPIAIYCNEKWLRFEQQLQTANRSIVYAPSRTIVNNSLYAGVSIRVAPGGDKFVVVKPWVIAAKEQA